MSELLTKFSIQSFEIKASGKRIIYSIPIGLLNILGAKPWSRQRPVDPDRVDIIYEAIREINDVPGVISMAWHPTENLVVYDGQHRFKAAIRVQPPSQIRVLVEVIWSPSSEDEIITAFKMVNQCVAVSELYMNSDSDCETTKIQIQEFVSKLAKKYDSFVSTKAKPNRPNFNRDSLTDDLWILWSDVFEKKVPFEKITAALLDINQEYHNNALSSARTAVKKNLKTYEKCERHEFWLFAETGFVNIDHIKSKL